MVTRLWRWFRNNFFNFYFISVVVLNAVYRRNEAVSDQFGIVLTVIYPRDKYTATKPLVILCLGCGKSYAVCMYSAVPLRYQRGTTFLSRQHRCYHRGFCRQCDNSVATKPRKQSVLFHDKKLLIYDVSVLGHFTWGGKPLQ